jgi:hypothetical protein
MRKKKSATAKYNKHDATTFLKNSLFVENGVPPAQKF